MDPLPFLIDSSRCYSPHSTSLVGFADPSGSPWSSSSLGEHFISSCFIGIADHMVLRYPILCLRTSTIWRRAVMLGILKIWRSFLLPKCTKEGRRIRYFMFNFLSFMVQRPRVFLPSIFCCSVHIVVAAE